MPVVLVYSPLTSRVSRRYYCFFCWHVIAARAAAAVPELRQEPTGEQDAQFIGVLMGVAESKPELKLGEFTNVSLDLRVTYPLRLMVGRVPFARFYPTGTDRVNHINESKLRLGRADE